MVDKLSTNVGGHIFTVRWIKPRNIFYSALPVVIPLFVLRLLFQFIIVPALLQSCWCSQECFWVWMGDGCFGCAHKMGCYERLVCSICQVKGDVEKISCCFICVDCDFQIISGENLTYFLLHDLSLWRRCFIAYR